MIRPKSATTLDIVRLLAKETLHSFLKNHDFEMAAALSSYGFFSLIPLLFFIMYLLGTYATSSQIAMEGVEHLTNHMLPQLSSIVSGEIHFLTGYKRTWGFISLIMLLVAIIPFTDTLRTAFLVTFRTRKEVSFLRAQIHNALAVLVLLGVFAILVGFEILYVLLSRHLLDASDPVLHGADIVVSLLVVVFLVFTFYITFLPSRVRLVHLAAASLVAAVLLISTRQIFSWFLGFNPEYGAMFGSLKTVFVLMGWVYCSFLVILLGAELMVNLGKRDALLLKQLFLAPEGAPHPGGPLMRRFVQAFDAGERVVTEGEPGSCMYYVLSGSVKVEREGQVLAHMKAGSYFGEMSMLLDAPRTATVTADQPLTELVVISRDNFELILGDNPRIVLAILREMASRLKATNESLGDACSADNP